MSSVCPLMPKNVTLTEVFVRSGMTRLASPPGGSLDARALRRVEGGCWAIREEMSKRRSEHHHHDRRHDGEETTEHVLHQIHRFGCPGGRKQLSGSGAEKKPM